MTLPRDFLMEIGGNYDLSPEEKEAFVIWFSSNKTGLEIGSEIVRIELELACSIPNYV
jgi:hypothetical protein